MLDVAEKAVGVRRCRPALGTFVSVDIDADDGSWIDAGSAIDAAFDAVARVDALMSFHRADSDLARLNGAGRGETVTLDAWTDELLRLAARLQRDSDGLFDCAVGAELIATGLLPGEPRPGGSGSLLHDLHFLDGHRVRVVAPVCLDLGGVAKGYAVDRAVEALRLRGVRQACVNAGGDLRVLGLVPRPIHLRTAVPEDGLRPFGTLADGALATSSLAFTGGVDAAGRWRSALLDPRTREPLSTRRTFSVLAPTCAVADGLTKVVAVTGRTDHPSLQRHGAVGFVV